MSDYNPAFPGRLNCKNLRFTDVDNLSTEQTMFDGYWEELINLYGVGLDYQVCRYDITKADNLYGEHITQAYADPVRILGLINLQENAVALSKYGFVTDDSITLYLHINTYTNTFSSFNVYGEPGTYADVNQKYTAPKAGDIFTLYEFGKTRPLGLGGKMFKVTERTDQDVGMNINQLAGHYVWVIQAKRYDPSYEPNVSEEKESYQIFDDPHTGRIENNTEIQLLPSEQKQYTYSAQQENIEKVFNYNKEMVNTSVYGGYLKMYSGDNVGKMSWYATTENINTFTLQPTGIIDNEYYNCILATEYGNYKQSIKIPSFYQLYKVEIYNKITNQWNVIGGSDYYSVSLFDTVKCVVEFDDDYYDYTQYTYNGPTVGQRDTKFYVKPISSMLNYTQNPFDIAWYATISGDGKMHQVSSQLTPDLYFECECASETVAKQAIQIPTQCTLLYVEIYNVITQSWTILGGTKQHSLELFDKTDTVINIDQQLYEYSQYTYNGPTVGQRKLRFYVDISSYTQPISSITDAPWFATTENIQTFTRQSDEFFVNHKYFECEMPAETSIFKQAIQIPAVYDVKYIKMFNETSNNWINLASDDNTLSFSKKQITKNINNISIAYHQFTNIGPMVGKRFLRFFIN